MLIVIILICIALIFLACFIGDRVDEDSLAFKFCIGSVAVSVGIGIICLLMTVISIGKVVGSSAIDEQINLYENENVRIEEHINSVVDEYKTYENDTLEKFNGSNGTEIISVHPELKANELIQEQMDIYYQNQTTILELKSEKIKMKPWKWWLYFGG